MTAQVQAVVAGLTPSQRAVVNLMSAAMVPAFSIPAHGSTLRALCRIGVVQVDRADDGRLVWGLTALGLLVKEEAANG